MNRDAVRTRVKTAVRRRIAKVDALDRLVVQRNDRRARLARLLEFYDRTRAQFTDLPPARPGELPDPLQVRDVQRAVTRTAATRAFVGDIADGGELDKAMVALVRTLLDSGDLGRSRSVAQVFQRSPATRPVGDVCQALVTSREPMLETAWELYRRNDVSVALRLAPLEFFRVGFVVEPEAAVAVLERALDGEFDLRLRPVIWLELARSSLQVGAEPTAVRAADRAAEGIATLAGPNRQRLETELAELRSWFGRRDAALAEEALPAGTVAVGVLDNDRPGRGPQPLEEVDGLGVLAALGNLVRRRGVRLSGDATLVVLAEALRAGVPPQLAVDGDDVTVALYRVDRDASEYDSLPDPTWLFASDTFFWFPTDLHRSLPMNPRVQPVFLGFHTEPWALHGLGVLDYLRAHGPVGCRDWRTVFLLQAAGVPAFFSGWLVGTLDTVADARATAVPDEYAPAVERLRTLSRPLETGDTGVYVAARTLGSRVDFRPELAGDVALDGLAGVSDEQFDAVRRRTLDLADTVLSAVLAGKGVDDVYEAWREACAPFVAEAEARRAQPLPELPPPSFDVTAAVAQTLAARVVVERSQPAPDGPEINVEFSLDGNYKHQLDVVLDSIVTRASRPIRAFVLARDHTPADFDRMARLFPTVSFVWLPTDNADYGPVSGMLKHITVATMDRLLLPDLLPDVDTIVHHDLDALCLADLAGLADLELGDRPIAARDQRHPFQGSGYIGMCRGVTMIDTIDRSRELMLRLTTRHPFDYRTFNAGIIVLNLAKMRADGFTRNFLPLVERFGFNDQALLNLYAGSQYLPFERSWNAYPRYELTEDAKILHWLGPWKPWHSGFIDGQPLWRAAEAQVAERERAAGLR